jgi:putative Mg2+ transporter-C (MgtC) family protein
MNDVWKALAEDFADVPDAAAAVRTIVRLVLAAVLGGLLGYERERKGKSAGMRTHMLIALGAALFALVPQQSGWSPEAQSRVLQGLAAGIGFLGAGPILKREQQGEVQGLTTAAGIWMAAAVGMTAGLGREVTAILATGLALGILALLPHVDRPDANGPKADRIRV